MYFCKPSVFRVLALLATGFSAVSSLPFEETSDTGASCRNPRIRKEWRGLSDYEKTDYIRAVKCLHTFPGKYEDIIATLTAFEDYIYVHKILTPYVHLVGHFLPWHRYFLWTYENSLRDRCGYQGAQPYWDYSLDVPPATSVTALLTSPIFSPTTGFGGNGEYVANDTSLPGSDIPRGAGGGCISDGPFKDWTIHISKNSTIFKEDRCVQRSLNPEVAKAWCNRDVEDEILAQPDYGWMSHVLEGEPSYAVLGMHGGGHFSVGGSAAEVFTANAEPLFYLHHANLDRIWWKWQSANPEERQYDISGPITPWANVLGPDYTGLPVGNVTLDFEIQLGRLGGPITVGDVMRTEGDFLCYKYV